MRVGHGESLFMDPVVFLMDLMGLNFMDFTGSMGRVVGRVRGCREKLLREGKNDFQGYKAGFKAYAAGREDGGKGRTL